MSQTGWQSTGEAKGLSVRNVRYTECDSGQDTAIGES